MKSNRLEAFSDGVIAIIITIMVLELKVPHEHTPAALLGLWPILLSYLLSFVIVGIYWVNHHHLLHLAQQVDRRTLWANMHLLFWLSLIPFATSYLGENAATPLSVAVYAGVMTICALAWWLLASHATAHLAGHAEVATLRGRRTRKIVASVFINAVAAPVAFVSVPMALVLLVAPLVLYFLPEKRMEQL